MPNTIKVISRNVNSNFPHLLLEHCGEKFISYFEDDKGVILWGWAGNKVFGRFDTINQAFEAIANRPKVGDIVTSKNRPSHTINENLYSHVSGRKHCIVQ